MLGSYNTPYPTDAEITELPVTVQEVIGCDYSNILPNLPVEPSTELSGEQLVVQRIPER